jgi:DNA helicase HerA-like ATPase
MKTDDRSRAIGKVISVAADRFVVELHRGSDNFTVVGFDDVHYVARLGSFIIIPVRAEYVVAEVVELREKDAGGMSDFEHNKMDKASSAKFLELVPVGTLPQGKKEPFRFGVSTFPSLYADALYALDDELDRIFDVADSEEEVPKPPDGDGDGKETRLKALTVGKSVIFAGYDVKARVDELFGGHAAVLGNTGSGKSCTVASIVQSLFEKTEERPARGASFVFLDVNGEYRNAFTELPKGIRRFYWQVRDDPESAPPKPDGASEETAVFRLPHWFMSAEEWELLLRASERTQQPVLRMALGLTGLLAEGAKIDEKTQNHILAKAILECFQSADGGATKATRMESLLTRFGTKTLNQKILKDHNFRVNFGNFNDPADQAKFLAALNVHASGVVSLPKYMNLPFPFEGLIECIELAITYEEAHGNRQIRDYCSQLVTRLKAVNEREDFAFLRIPEAKLAAHEKSAFSYVDRIVGIKKIADGQYEKTTQVTLIDLNNAADEVVEVASAVLARLVFERMRRADPRNRLPVNMVLEEAHRYISEGGAGFAINASKIFERIAKEGRKYGVFLLLASQRPSELSKTVLSQCSNFIVHRIQNPDDLRHIRQMTPFISESVMKRLPSLPKQHALIFGNAVNLPTTFKVRDVNPKPKSDDANMRELLFRKDGTPIMISWQG